MTGIADLSAGTEVLGIPNVPVWEEHDIETPPQFAVEGTALAAFHLPEGACSYGIGYDIDAIVCRGYDPNVVLLHELVHAWQYYLDPQCVALRHSQEVLSYGYWDAPHEREARLLSSMMHEAGIRVWFPEVALRTAS